MEAESLRRSSRTTGILSSLLCLSVSVIVLLTGCGSGVDTLNMTVDERRTVELSGEYDQKFCFILGSEVCQSADSALFFHLPKDLRMVPVDRTVDARLRISNEGRDSIVIEAYAISVLDDRSVKYTADFRATNGYDNTQPFTPAAVLVPYQDMSVTFSVELDVEATYVTSILVRYKLRGELGYQQVVVSYQATNLLQVYEQRRG